MTAAPHWQAADVVLYLGDCLKVLAGLEPSSFDAIVTDPPYGLEFMGAEWDKFGRDTGNGYREKPRWTPDHMGKGFDQLPNHFTAGRPYQEWCRLWAMECLRVLKPGGFMLAFGGTRTSHRLACGIEDAGFEIRDATADLTGQDAPGLMWIYGSGFPKSKNAGRAVDMHVCAEPGRHCANQVPDKPKPGDHVCAESEEGDPWRGYGTAAKPAWEPIIVARKPMTGTLAANLLEHGTGALNLDDNRIAVTDDAYRRNASGDRGHENNRGRDMAFGMTVGHAHDAGRWPPNVVLGPSAAAELDRQSGLLTSGANPARRNSDVFSRDVYGDFAGQRECVPRRGADSGGASRFFPVFRYEPKASAEERPRLADGTAHPTVKPRGLVARLVRLVSRPGALILDPFAGSGTTGEACLMTGRRCVLIEQWPPFAELVKVRLSKPIQPDLFDLEATCI